MNFKLQNNYEIPSICFGTDIVSEGYFDDDYIKQFLKRRKRWIEAHLDKSNVYKRNMGIINCVEESIASGCNFFDTSRAYGGSEIMLGQALKNNKRSDFFVCTKLCNYDQLNGKPAEECLQESLKRLGLSYVDLYLLHWPVEGKYLSYWKELEALYKKGYVKAIGVSNCKIHHLEEIRKIAEITPMVNEIELHPLLTETEMRDYCKNNGIQIMAYTSTARLDFRLVKSRRMESVCIKHRKTLSQIILRWHIQNGIIPIFNTSSLTHLKSNLDVFDFELDDQDMQLIESMNINSRTRYDSDNCEWDRL